MLSRLSGVRPLLRLGALLLTVFSLGFMLLPIVVIVGSSFGSTSYLTFPPKGLTLKWYSEVLSLTQFVQPLKISILLSSFAATAATILSLGLSYALVRYNVWGKSILNALFLSPVIIPLVVTGAAFLLFFTRIGVHSRFATLVIAYIIINIPYAMRAITASLQTCDISLEEAAMSLGANRVKTFLKITLPQIRAGVVAGWLFTFALSFDEFAVAVFLSGPGCTTFPVELFQYIRWSVNPVIGALSTILIIFASTLVFIMDRMGGIEAIMGLESYSGERR